VDISLQLLDVLLQHDAATKVAALRQGRERSELLFPSAAGTYLDRANVEKAFKRVLKKAGLAPHFTPHSLRHTFASLLLQKGVSPAYVQEQLGHSSITLTVDTYGKWLPKGNPEIADLLDDRPEPLANLVVANGAESGSSDLSDSETAPAELLPAELFGLGGPHGDRTHDLLIANQALSHLS